MVVSWVSTVWIIGAFCDLEWFNFIKCLIHFFPLICVGFQTINTAQAVFLPVGASFSLLVMFFFFDTLQFFFALCTAGEWNNFYLNWQLKIPKNAWVRPSLIELVIILILSQKSTLWGISWKSYQEGKWFSHAGKTFIRKTFLHMAKPGRENHLHRKSICLVPLNGATVTVFTY